MKETSLGMRRFFFGVKHVLVKRFCFRLFCLWIVGQDCIISNLPPGPVMRLHESILLEMNPKAPEPCEQ